MAHKPVLVTMALPTPLFGDSTLTYHVVYENGASVLRLGRTVDKDSDLDSLTLQIRRLLLEDLRKALGS